MDILGVRGIINRIMRIFKKIFLIVIIGILLFIPTVSFADSYGLKKAADTAGLEKKVGSYNTPFEVIGGLVGAGLSLIGLLFFGLTLYAGIMWMIARGDSSKVDRAKEILESAIIGLVIVVSAYAIVNFVLKALTNPTANSSSPIATTTQQ